MTGHELTTIVKHVPNSTLKKWIKHHEGLHEAMPRPPFI